MKEQFAKPTSRYIIIWIRIILKAISELFIQLRQPRAAVIDSTAVLSWTEFHYIAVNQAFISHETQTMSLSFNAGRVLPEVVQLHRSLSSLFCV